MAMFSFGVLERFESDVMAVECSLEIFRQLNQILQNSNSVQQMHDSTCFLYTLIHIPESNVCPKRDRSGDMGSMI